MSARTLALEYLKLAKQYGPPMAFGNTTIDDAIAGLEAETGEPAAWIDPRDLVILKSKDWRDFRFAGVANKNSRKMTTPLYTAPPSAVPPGWKLVPIEPTPEMWKAGLAHLFRDVDAVWRAILAEVPEAPK